MDQDRDIEAEIREWLTEMAVRWRDGEIQPSAVLPARWGGQIREYGSRYERCLRSVGSALSRHVVPVDVTFYAKLADGTEIAVPVDTAGLKAMN